MIYNIRLTITHHYDQPAANGRHVVRVLPKTLPGRQRLLTQLLSVVPEPSETFQSQDFFGNAALTCSHHEQHPKMAIRLACHVEIFAPAPWLDLSPNVPQLREEWERSSRLDADAPLHFLGPTARLGQDGDIAKFARNVCDPSQSAAANVIRLGQAIYDIMQFDSAATTVDTDAAEAFRLKRGVCQDFSHIMILGLHALGIPAGYVSGYLRTLPPEGGVKLEGVDAMHAWVRAWCGTQQGWIEYDPTNATLVGSDHIVVGYGRDYSDVSPVNGHLRSSGGQRNTQSVDVAIVD